MTLFQGLSAFPITPTNQAGVVDTSALAIILNRIREAGADSIGLLGSTGGYAFLSRDQRRRALETTMATVGGKIPVIVGVGALRTDEAEALARDAREAGADGLLLAPVSYTPLTEQEVYEHYAAVTDVGQLPLCVYSNPSTTRFTFSVELIERLAKVRNIVAIKMPLPADGDYSSEMATIRRHTASTFATGYSGDWGAADALLAGADAWYSVVAGLLPSEALALARAARSGDAELAARLNKAFEPLWSLFKEFGSFRVMFAVADIIGIGAFEPPRPVLGLHPEARARVAEAIYGLRTATHRLTIRMVP
ncbi:4-hydroxy-tetrahydrodipicolinate synthase [Pararhizobium capsulatum DSM 1112]|uniref:4-hydroxy-tetrahydrodipicolinate synthase n=1 Tax=Pararhizobium capsulatum DSM 1112 TaxID=1121113 RepID=A0ABU0BY06_9HYPH|nr:dihydrodipicolinate synthase family protein [Pararhizobium capsulatum]MDQ0323145.1 4-hydroxy-tetrahydrodipicolinate synthase [Pararhizobium capsulatum DSM 1112]